MILLWPSEDAAGHVLTAPSMALAILAPGMPRPLNRLPGIELGNASVGVPFALALDTLIRGGTPPFTWAVAPGSALPAGLTPLPGANGVSTYV